MRRRRANRLRSILIRIINSARSTLKAFWRTLIDNLDALVILVLATMGLSNLISQLPNVVQLPAIFEAQYFAPVVASLAVGAATVYMKQRETNDELKFFKAATC